MTTRQGEKLLPQIRLKHPQTFAFASQLMAICNMQLLKKACIDHDLIRD